MAWHKEHTSPFSSVQGSLHHGSQFAATEGSSRFRAMKPNADTIGPRRIILPQVSRTEL